MSVIVIDNKIIPEILMSEILIGDVISNFDFNSLIGPLLPDYILK